jgi:diaminopimelate epimerase
MKFTKMQGTGNDFVVINAIREKLPADMTSFAKSVADRKFGVGCDQLLVVDKSDKADFKMLIFNNDGSEVEMCGNGIRCLAKFVRREGLTEKTQLSVETIAGKLKRTEIIGDRVRVDMDEPALISKDWYHTYPVDVELRVDNKNFNVTLVSMGNPHCVIFVPKITNEQVLGWGPKIENHIHAFPNKINVEFARIINRSEIEMRVWERGAGETLACGTGACATAVAGILNQRTDAKVVVHMSGGDLDIEWKGKETSVFMTGPAEFVFDGELQFKG